MNPLCRLHRHLVSRLSPNSTLFVLFDCCHSGSALELPFVYRTDDDGNLNMMDNLKAGLQLIGEANEILRGGLRFDARGLSEARSLYGDATNFFKGLQHMGGGGGEEGIAAGEEGLEEEWGQERKVVTMFSGCRDGMRCTQNPGETPAVMGLGGYLHADLCAHQTRPAPTPTSWDSRKGQCPGLSWRP